MENSKTFIFNFIYSFILIAIISIIYLLITLLLDLFCFLFFFLNKTYIIITKITARKRSRWKIMENINPCKSRRNFLITIEKKGICFRKTIHTIQLNLIAGYIIWI